MTDHLTTLYSGFAARLARTPDMGVDAMRDLFEGWHLGTTEPTGVQYAEAEGAPVPATWCRALGGSGRVVVHAHGGGFVVGSRHSHRKLAGHLAARAGASALVVDYRRAPEHPFPAAIDDLVSTVGWLIDAGHRPADIVLSGDSAGGNLALSAALRLVERGTPPAGVVALSAWFDLATTGESLAENADHDAMVDRPTLQLMAELYLAGESPDAAAVNPLHADLAPLPPLYLAASRHKTLRDDTMRLAERARAAGVPVTLELEDGQQHVYQMGAGRLAVADESLTRIGRWISGLPRHAEPTAQPTVAGGAG
jgi:monoterpene epsilon-lactone hydrolase